MSSISFPDRFGVTVIAAYNKGTIHFDLMGDLRRFVFIGKINSLSSINIGLCATQMFIWNALFDGSKWVKSINNGFIRVWWREVSYFYRWEWWLWGLLPISFCLFWCRGVYSAPIPCGALCDFFPVQSHCSKVGKHMERITIGTPNINLEWVTADYLNLHTI